MYADFIRLETTKKMNVLLVYQHLLSSFKGQRILRRSIDKPEGMKTVTGEICDVILEHCPISKPDSQNVAIPDRP